MNETPKFFVDELPKEICLGTNLTVDEPSFVLRRRGSDGCTPCPTPNSGDVFTVRLLRCENCKYTALLDEAVAYCGEGIFDLELWDDCDLCGSVCVELSADCFLTSATMTSASAASGKRCCANG